MTRNICCFLLLFCFATTIALADISAALFEAIDKSDAAAVEAVLAQGVDVNKKDKEGSTPLHSAAYRKNGKKIAELLISKGADVNAMNSFGKTPLHAMLSNPAFNEFAELLISKGANVNAKDHGGSTPIIIAASENNKALVALLISKGADVNVADGLGWTPLFRALSVDRQDNDVAELLISKGADVNLKDRQGRTTIYKLAECTMNCEDDKKAIELLISKGADVNIKDKNDRTALITAIGANATEIAELLLSHGAERNFNEYQLESLFKMNPPLSIPEEARRYFIEGEVLVKEAKSPEQQQSAVSKFKEALLRAPWWAEAYYNLGVAQELATEYEGAKQSFELYLRSNPPAEEARAVQDRIYKLGAKQELKQ